MDTKDLSDDIIDSIIIELDNYARNFDSYDYGLPTHTNSHIEEMRNIVKLGLSKTSIDSWTKVSDQEPPEHIDVLAKSPEGVVHICSWRKAYNIFTVQGKRESSLDWKWKCIE